MPAAAAGRAASVPAAFTEPDHTAWATSPIAIVPSRISEVVTAPAQQKRYSRHVLIPEVGKEGQLKLVDSKVLIIGAGGLGSRAAYYLAAAGVGTIGMVDSDVVDESNLQRQILHNSKRIGQPKVDSAKQTLEDLNPDVKVVPYQTRLTRDNIIDIFKDYDLIVDGSDNFPTRYLVNDASVLLKKTVVHGSIFRFDGQVTVFKPFEGPCYRCVFPEPPPPELAPSCDEAGTLGILPGIVGLFEANEAVKLLLGIGEPLIGRLLMIDALTDEFRTLRLKRDTKCPVCGEGAHFKDFVDYEVSTAIPTPAMTTDVTKRQQACRPHARDCRDLADWKDRELRVRQCLRIVGAGAVVGCLPECVGLRRIQETHGDAHRRKRVGKQIPGAAVKVGGADDIVARARKIHHRESRCCLS